MRLGNSINCKILVDNFQTLHNKVHNISKNHEQAKHHDVDVTDCEQTQGTKNKINLPSTLYSEGTRCLLLTTKARTSLQAKENVLKSSIVEVSLFLRR